MAAKVFATTNLTKASMQVVAPWEFTPTEPITDRIRDDRDARQAWYQNPKTSHQFYTLVEPANPNARPSKKDNPPKFLHGLVFDVDVPLTEEQLDVVLQGLNRQPTYLETSLGRKHRFVWLFENPLRVDGYEICSYLLQQSLAWVRGHNIPGLDEKALAAPERLYANGCAWERIGTPIPDADVTEWFVNTVREWKGGNFGELTIPFPDLYKALSEKYPRFADWPGEFEPEAQGPSFWVPGSVSTKSAIAKPGGMYTFAAHAEKSFYTWAELLGDWVSKYRTVQTSSAVSDIFFDGVKYYYRIPCGRFVSVNPTDIKLHLRITCKLSVREDKATGVSPVDVALKHIQDHNLVEGGGPFLYRNPGLIEWNGYRIVNTSDLSPIRPAPEPTVWGPTGRAPWICALYDSLFAGDAIPGQRQLDYFLTWWQYFYIGALEKNPAPGHNLFMVGSSGLGKTFSTRYVIGPAMGGFADAADFLLGKDSFNSEMFGRPVWALDDDSPSSNESERAKYHAALKRVAANQAFRCNKKHASATMVEWQGRLIATANPDYVSTRALPAMDDNASDKFSMLMCADVATFEFPDRRTATEIVAKELPHFLRILVDYKPPGWIKLGGRYGMTTYHDPRLIERVMHTSRSSQFAEIISEWLSDYWVSEPKATEWSGTTSALIRMLSIHPGTGALLRGYTAESVTRNLEHIQRTKGLPCRTHTVNGMRIWTFTKP